MKDTKTTKADAAAATRKPRVNLREAMLTHPDYFHARYINMAAITVDGRTISAQQWCSSMEDIYEAEDRLCNWATPKEEKWHGKLLRAVLYDTYQKTTREYKRVEAGLKEVL
jgi:hypothetical protein